MKLYSKNLTSFSFAFPLFFLLTCSAMEEEKKTIIQKTNVDVIEEMYTAFSKNIDEKLPKKTLTFFEAVVRIQSIERLIELSQITCPMLGDDFIITKKSFWIGDFEVPHHVSNQIFNDWLTTACNKVLLEHPQSVEAIDEILTKIDAKISLKTLDKYHKAILSLPSVVSEHIQDSLIDTYCWPLGLKPFLCFGENGKLKSFAFVKNSHIYEGQEGYICNRGIFISPDKKIILTNDRPKFYGKDNLSEGLCQELGFDPLSCQTIKPLKALSPKEEPSGVFPVLWEKQTFNKALKICATRNERLKKKAHCLIS